MKLDFFIMWVSHFIWFALLWYVIGFWPVILLISFYWWAIEVAIEDEL